MLAEHCCPTEGVVSRSPPWPHGRVLIEPCMCSKILRESQRVTNTKAHPSVPIKRVVALLRSLQLHGDAAVAGVAGKAYALAAS